MITPEDDTDPHAEQLRLVEALLFAASGPLDEAALAERLPEGTDIGTLLAELERHYRPRGVNIVRIANGWTLRTAADLAPRLHLERKVARKLSRAAIETLAIVAYHQPVTRAEIEDIRGVIISKGTLDTLMEIGWIEPKGRRQTVGRPVTWATTEDFLLHFGLADVRDLPGVDELRAAGLIGPRAVTSLTETIHPQELAREPEEEEADERAEALAAEADDEPAVERAAGNGETAASADEDEEEDEAEDDDETEDEDDDDDDEDADDEDEDETEDRAEADVGGQPGGDERHGRPPTVVIDEVEDHDRADDGEDVDGRAEDRRTEDRRREHREREGDEDREEEAETAGADGGGWAGRR